MTAPRAYTAAQVREKLQLSKSAFFLQLRAGKLPFLEELQPRTGRSARYRGDLFEAYLNNQWHREHANS
jgi:hypothetical protein